jgi:hypothetical protein
VIQWASLIGGQLHVKLARSSSPRGQKATSAHTAGFHTDVKVVCSQATSATKFLLLLINLFPSSTLPTKPPKHTVVAMRFTKFLVAGLASTATASTWFGKTGMFDALLNQRPEADMDLAYNKWHETELERWLSDHDIPYPTPSDRKDLENLVKTNWQAQIVDPLAAAGDKTTDSYESVKEWIFDSQVFPQCCLSFADNDVAGPSRSSKLSSTTTRSPLLSLVLEIPTSQALDRTTTRLRRLLVNTQHTLVTGSTRPGLSPTSRSSSTLVAGLPRRPLPATS